MAGRKDDAGDVNRADTWSATAAGPSPGRIVTVRSHDDLRLSARLFDAEALGRLPLLCLPGLSRNSRDFLDLGRFFSNHPEEPRAVIALDSRGRGLSEADPDWRQYTPAVEAQDVVAAAVALGIERTIVVGTSRGGIIAMLLGGMRPGLLAGVVLNDIGPVIETEGLARIKGYLGSRRHVRTWQDAVAVTREIAGAYFPALSEDDWRAFTAAYFAPSGEGALAPQFADNLLRAVKAIDLSEKSPELWPQFASLSAIPVLAIRGERSDLLSEATLSAMAERHPRLEALTVPGQGHPPLLRDPPTLERIRAFAARCDAAEPA